MDFLIGASNSGIHQLDWDPYIAALKADGTTVNDMNANATLPTSALSTIMLCRQRQWPGSWAGHAPSHVCGWQSRRGRPI